MYIDEQVVLMTKKPIRDYRDLAAWQQAIELAVELEAVCDALPRKLWNLASQLRRAANAVHSNISEGNGRPTADYHRMLKIAKASLNEIESDLHFVARRYPSMPGLAQARERVDAVVRPLAGLIKSIKRKVEEDS